MGLDADLVNVNNASNDLLTIAPNNALEGVRQGQGRWTFVAVESWYDSLDTGMALHSRNLDYTTLRQPSPIFLAALAQVSKSFNGCDGMTLVTHEAAQKKRQRLLAFTAEDAMGWLRPDLEWPEALLLARHNAVGEAAGSVPPEAVIWIGLRRG